MSGTPVSNQFLLVPKSTIPPKNNSPIHKPMNQQPNEQHQAEVKTTLETEEPLFLQQAAALCGVKEVTLRSWCKKKHIKWKRINIGKKSRRMVLMSDVRAYIAKRNPSDVGRVEASPAMVHQTQPSKASQVTESVTQMLTGNTASKLTPAPSPAPSSEVQSNQSTTETNSTSPSLNVAAAVSQSGAAIKQATAATEASPKQKTKPPHGPPPRLLIHRAKNSMRKFGADDLRKISSWITQRLDAKFETNTNLPPAEQPTPAS